MTINKKPHQNEKGYTLYASFIPILLIIGIILGAGYFLMKGEFKLPSIGRSKTEVRRLKGFPTTIYTSENIEKKRAVITNKTELSEFLNSVDSTGQLVVPEDIDFEKEFLVGASTETRDTTGYKITVKKVYADKKDESLLISIRETRPAETCEVEDESNVSIDLVALTKTDWEIGFEKVTEYENCE